MIANEPVEMISLLCILFRKSSILMKSDENFKKKNKKKRTDSLNKSNNYVLKHVIHS